jgi:hypothetical protein
MPAASLFVSATDVTLSASTRSRKRDVPPSLGEPPTLAMAQQRRRSRATTAIPIVEHVGSKWVRQSFCQGRYHAEPTVRSCETGDVSAHDRRGVMPRSGSGLHERETSPVIASAMTSVAVPFLLYSSMGRP